MLYKRVPGMKADRLVAHYNQAISSRNRFLFAGIGLFVLNILQAVSLIPLIAHQNIVVVPATFHREFWVGNHQASDSYVEQMSQYFSILLLNVTPSTFENAIETILQHVASEHYADFKSHLVQQKEEINKRGISSTFHVSNFKVYRKPLRAKLRGELRIMLANTSAQSKTSHYQLDYVHRHGRLYIQSFKEISKEEFERD